MIRLSLVSWPELYARRLILWFQERLIQKGRSRRSGKIKGLRSALKAWIDDCIKDADTTSSLWMSWMRIQFIIARFFPFNSLDILGESIFKKERKSNCLPYCLRMESPLGGKGKLSNRWICMLKRHSQRAKSEVKAATGLDSIFPAVPRTPASRFQIHMHITSWKGTTRSQLKILL